jgi:hypothetical protein
MVFSRLVVEEQKDSLRLEFVPPQTPQYSPEEYDRKGDPPIFRTLAEKESKAKPTKK